MTYFSQLPAPNFFAASKVVADPRLVPNGRGVYFWSFNEKLGIAPDAKFEWGGRLLSYIGIAPSRATSASSLRSRLRAHLRGNASSSTLRLTLGCLLAESLSLTLSPTGATGRLTFGEGEGALSDWLAEHAHIAWAEHPEPWLVEPGLVAQAATPLNLDHNTQHEFAKQLSQLRAEQRAQARVVSTQQEVPADVPTSGPSALR